MALGLGILGGAQVATAAEADGFAFTPRVEGGFTSYSYEATKNYPLGVRKISDYSDTLPTMTVGATAAMAGFYLDGYWQGTTEGSDSCNAAYEPNDTRWEMNTDFDRQEYALTAGYKINGFSFFAGYQNSDLSLTEKTKPFSISTNVNSVYYLSDNSLKADGPFVGIGYSLPVGPGTISASAAYAWLNGKFEENSTGYWNDGTLYTESGDIEISEPDATGVKIGLSWSAPITGQLSYSVAVNGQWYSYDRAVGRVTGTDYSTATGGIDHDESLISVLAGIKYTFGTK